jgi:antitoxin CptB
MVTSGQWQDNQPSINQLRWACRRGLLELDLLLNSCLDNVYEQLTDGEKQRFISLLDMQDQEMYEMLTGKTSPNDKQLTELLERIRDCMGG